MTPRDDRPVVVVPYDPAWPAAFEAERRRLAQDLGSAVVAIHHVGSTAVPGLAAKPVIDVLVEATALDAVDARSAALEARGYAARGEYGIPGRRYFSRAAGANASGRRPDGGRPPGTADVGGGSSRDAPAVHVHVFATGSEEALRHLRFRDRLRASPETARAYEELKLRLARSHPRDRAAYQAGKAAFIEGVLRDGEGD